MFWTGISALTWPLVRQPKVNKPAFYDRSDSKTFEIPSVAVNAQVARACASKEI
jgi:hypothetical protein